ncbi:hypothetical protein M501DRAFT_941806 [Patellaria atrata CBS 101060]|uniref:PWWP domain-containing protein n=1 Tax=Patellaria atrata CBS 101060 TaxID=1346257 RepID=A0A9P4VNA2_9PEZI|nr:hypothetical protein M501DRAFT_941806 [Patellaria atrata CBS 101060]
MFQQRLALFSSTHLTLVDKQELANEAPNGTGNSKKAKRRSSGIPEHKTKKPIGKKKSMQNLNIDVQPGEYWFAKMKGYPQWPCVICDEEMLPETLLKNRPVSAKRVDGTYREDFDVGGKNVRDRKFPVMFLGTNEFYWINNTDLVPLDVDEVKRQVESNEQGKKSRVLWKAYQVAAEESTLDDFKTMLLDFEKERLQEEERKAAEVAEKEAKKEKAAKRKSKDAKSADDDVEMADADEEVEAPKSSKSKKRKAPDEEADGAKASPAKTPKKLNLKVGKSANEDSAAKPKKVSKLKKAAKNASSEDIETKAEPIISEAEQREKRKKAVLYLRHKLQKGFLTRDQTPKEDEMSAMAEHFNSLEKYPDLDASIIRETKIHKVLKGIIKLNSIPKDEEFKFKERSTTLLNHWNKVLAADGGDAPAGESSIVVPTTNGVDHGEPNGTKSPKSPAEAAPGTLNGAINEAEAKIEASVTLDDKANDGNDEKSTAPEVASEAAIETNPDVTSAETAAKGTEGDVVTA